MSNEPIFAEERQNKIISMLKIKNKLLVNELCDTFSVSPATIRNDLNSLEKRGLLKRTHGGAISGGKAGFEPTSVQKAEKNRSQKEIIAKAAAALVENGDTIALDSGTTAMRLAEQLSGKQGITIITTDIRIAKLLEDFSGVSVILAGGTLRKGFSCTTGSITNSVLKSLNVDKAFIAANAVNPRGQLCTPDIEQAEIKKNLIAMAAQTILICDSSKFGAYSFAKFGNLSDIDTVITDGEIDESVLKNLKNLNPNIEVAE